MHEMLNEALFIIKIVLLILTLLNIQSHESILEVFVKAKFVFGDLFTWNTLMQQRMGEYS